MKILIVSVPHSASRFVRMWFEEEDENVEYRHVYTQSMAWILASVRESVVILPVRHPLKTALSTKRRREDMAELPGLFDRLVEVAAIANPLYLCIDNPDKETQLATICRAVGERIEVDWTHYRQPARIWVHEKLTDDDIQMANDIYTKHKEFFTNAGVCVELTGTVT